MFSPCLHGFNPISLAFKNHACMQPTQILPDFEPILARQTDFQPEYEWEVMTNGPCSVIVKGQRCGVWDAPLHPDEKASLSKCLYFLL